MYNVVEMEINTIEQLILLLGTAEINLCSFICY